MIIDNYYETKKMRSETDVIYSKDGKSIIFATGDKDGLTIFTSEEYIDACIELDKEQVKELARQLLEMCGEE
jgi:hypothetical protein